MSAETIVISACVPLHLEITSLAEAAYGSDEHAIAMARTHLVEAIGAAAMIDSATVIANFQHMVKVADGTGIPLDAPVVMGTAGIREERGINKVESAAGNEGSLHDPIY